MAAEKAHENRPATATGGLERRAYPRHQVDCEAEVLPVSGSVKIKGRLADLSLGGCRVIAEQRYTAGILVRMEVQFQIRGIAFRIVGVTVGSRDARVFAVRFLDMPERRRRELAEVLEEVVAYNAAQAAIAEAQPPMPESSPAEEAAPVAVTVVDFFSEQPVQIANAAPTTSTEKEEKPASPPKPESIRERRFQSRHPVDTSAKLLLVKTAISMPGHIVNLSLGGCRIRTQERFNVGIYVRVEAEFYLHGLPFRVGGVSQAILDRNTIGVRFLDISDRRRAQLEELIAEIAEAAALRLVPGTTAGGELPTAG